MSLVLLYSMTNILHYVPMAVGRSMHDSVIVMIPNVWDLLEELPTKVKGEIASYII
jgi:hypothetical protein